MALLAGSRDPAWTISPWLSRFGHSPHASVNPRPSSVGGSTEHQQFDEHLGSLDQAFPGAPDTSDATDLYLESGGSLSGPDVVFCVWSVHRLFRLAQTSVRILNRRHTDMNHSSFHTCQTSKE